MPSKNRGSKNKNQRKNQQPNDFQIPTSNQFQGFWFPVKGRTMSLTRVILRILKNPIVTQVYPTVNVVSTHHSAVEVVRECCPRAGAPLPLLLQPPRGRVPHSMEALPEGWREWKCWLSPPRLVGGPPPPSLLPSPHSMETLPEGWRAGGGSLSSLLPPPRSMEALPEGWRKGRVFQCTAATGQFRPLGHGGRGGAR